jgi:EAL and modified HD-GYP domain-containing signal transduction protein
MAKINNVLLARQPIFDKELVTIGYELLYRPIPSEDEGWQRESGDLATNEVLVSAFDDIGLHDVTAGCPAYINFTEHWLSNPPPFNPKSVVIEILEHIPATPDNVKAIIALRKKGFLIALDDYLGDPEQDPFLPYVDIIKLDILAFKSINEVQKTIEQKGKDSFLWLAEKVETKQVFEACLAAGCDYFQGYFFSRPVNIYGNKLGTNKQLILELIIALQDEEITPHKLENLLSKDPSLSFRLLKLVNSAAFKQQSNVDSLQRAVAVTGLDQIKTWVLMLSLGKFEDKPPELCKQSLQRALFCQFLANFLPEIRTDIAFTAGLFSNLDAYFDIPLEELIEKIDLQEDIKEALTKKTGKLGFVFTTVIKMERGEWQNIRWPLWKKLGLNPSDIESLYLESLIATEEILKSNPI